MSKAFQCRHNPVQLNRYFVSPLRTSIRNFNSILDYYMYYAPNIESKHSSGRIEDNRAQVILEKIIESADLKNRYTFYVRESSKPFEQLELDQNDTCLKCCRFVCKRGQKEGELTALLRHIRNSFAHGLVYVKPERQTKCILLEDYDKRTKKISARLVLTAKILEDWKAILENEIATGE